MYSHIKLYLCQRKIVIITFETELEVTKLLKGIAYNPMIVTIVLGIILLIFQEIKGELTVWIQIFFAFGFVFFIGIPHRVMDIWLEQEHQRRAGKPFNKILFYIRYIISIALLSTLWYFVPTLSIILFLLLTAWHIGESDLKNVPANNILWTWTRFVYGLFIVSWLFLLHGSQASILWASITKQDYFMMQIWLLLNAYSNTIITTLGVMLTLLLLLVQWKFEMPLELKKVLFLISILVISAWLPLLPAIGLYFGGWHAVNAFSDAHRYFLPQGRSILTAFQLWLHIMPLTLVAVFLTLGYAYFWASYAKSMNPIPILYLLVACTILPHQLLISQLNKQDKSIR